VHDYLPGRRARGWRRLTAADSVVGWITHSRNVTDGVVA